jgi:hypothetical protein
MRIMEIQYFLMKNHLRMLTKVLIVGFLLVSCTNQYKELITNDSEFTKLINNIDSVLPKNISPIDYLLIYRTGSIKYSSDYTVLCIKKKDLMKKSINCKYFMINNIGQLYRKYPNLESDEPKILGFSFLLNNPRGDFKLNRLMKYSPIEVDKYLDSVVKVRSGEGHCDNMYYLVDNKDIYIVNSTWPSLELDLVISLYKQISPSEYFQTFSLRNQCNENDINTYMKFFKPEYKDSFKVSHHDLGRYW